MIMDFKQRFNHFRQIGLIPDRDVEYERTLNGWKALFVIRGRMYQVTERTKSEAFNELARVVVQHAESERYAKAAPSLPPPFAHLQEYCQLSPSAPVDIPPPAPALLPEPKMAYNPDSFIRAGGTFTFNTSFSGDGFLAVFEAHFPKFLSKKKFVKRGYHHASKSLEHLLSECFMELNSSF
ncbi:hypothetical protein [Beihai tiger crab virus 1]|uniref:hypothetical protein n=1 Tax=Beihai tiger crab virus 1 TaxID=1922711 RepID=UPI00090C9EAF|nr:hypothetical protein [Beihai tiger crab virus 1]APG77636.1 hypothetical protein [Beihai tiger crab virus 1]